MALRSAHRSEKCIFTCRGITIRGAGEQLTNGKATSANVGGLLSPRTDLRLHFGAGFELLALNIEADALARKLGAIIGSPPSKPILFEVDPEFSHPSALRLRRLIEFLVEKLSSDRRDMPLVALVEIEQALMTWFLIGNRHNYSHLLDSRSRWAAPWQVKRAEEYIEASWDQPLTIEVLAAVRAQVRAACFIRSNKIAGTPLWHLFDKCACNALGSCSILRIPAYR